MALPASLEIVPEQIEFGMIIEETELEENEEAEYIPRQRNLGKAQHRRFTGYDQTLPVVLYGFREETVHGISTDGTPHSLIVFRWAIQQRSSGRRFKSATLRALFRTTRKKSSVDGGGIDAFYDPQVVDLAPNGTYSMLATPVTLTNSHGVEAGLQGGMDFIKGSAKATYELSQSVEARDQIVINGFERNDYDYATADEVGDPDRCNVAEWQLFENEAVKSGLPTFFRTAVLLERRPGDLSHFTCNFTIRPKIDDLTDALIGVKRFIGLLPRDDPIIFDPKLEEGGPLSGHKNALEKVALLDLCKFVMFKAGLGPLKDSEASEETSKQS